MDLKKLTLCLALTAAACRSHEGGEGEGFGGGGESGWDDDEGRSGGGGGGGGGSDACMSGSWWNGGNEESPDMHPGGNCIGCHSGGEGPAFTVAGTVYTEYDEPVDCNGFRGATVEVTDARGQVWRETTNAAGNFYFRDSSVQFPITARVIDGGAVREMASEVSTGNCASCHTAGGTNGAPGRVIAP